MASTTSFQDQSRGELTGAVAGTSTGLIQKDGTFRRYRSGLSISVYEHGSWGYNRRSIFYEVGRRSSRLKDALAYKHGNEDCVPIDASVAVNPAQAANFEGWARKYSNFSPQWDMMDLAGMVERLAKGIACQSIFGGVTAVNLRGDQPLRVVALGTLDSPQTASSDSVFIPRTVDSVGNDHVFAVLVAAANGEGAAVTTDVLRLDPGNNEPIVPSVSGQPLAQACVEALRVLGANMEESGAGDVFSYALTRGIHSVVSVVSHTDEGGWLRGVLREGSFRVPYGGINQGLREYPALPPLAGLGPSATSAWVDAVALKTAAVVAHCDPCVIASGGLYPTVFTADDGEVGDAGREEEAPTDRNARTIGRQIAADSGRFAPLFIQGLNKVFGRTTNSGIAEGHFCTSLSYAIYDGSDRHLKHKTVAPYFWIEPTSLIPRDFLGSAAERAGFGALVTSGSEFEMPYFEKFRELDRGRNANFSTIAFKMRTARTSGLIAAHAGAPAPLAGLKLYQFDEDSIVLAGDQGPTAGSVPTKHAAADPVSSYLWKRGQSAIPAPAEFINTQGSFAAKYKIVEWDDDFNATMDDLPEPWEIENYSVKWRVSVPTALGEGKSNAGDSGARRARSRAAIALAQASLKARGYGDAHSPVITVSNVPPSWDETPPAPVRTEDLKTHASDPGHAVYNAEGNPPDQSSDLKGASLHPIPHHQPLRGAPYPRTGGGQLAGGAAPSQPPPPGPPAGGYIPPAGPSDSDEPSGNEAAAGATPAPPA